MILEHAVLNVKMGQAADFETDFNRAQKIISQMPGYIEHSLQRHHEVENQYLLLVKWERLEDHSEGFRKSEAYGEWRALLHHYYEPFPTVDYYEPVEGCVWQSNGNQQIESQGLNHNTDSETGDIDLVLATNTAQWEEASLLLIQCAEQLAERGTVLWRAEELTVPALQKSYQLNELYFLKKSDSTIGLVFLQNQDHIFWPESLDDSALYVHKLIVNPELVGQGLGKKALNLVIREARQRDRTWLRLDCDDRPPLNRFYQNCGFVMVDKVSVQDLNVVRYQMRLN